MRPRGIAARLLALAAIILLSILFVAPVRVLTRGHLSLPLDDGFIYFQLARSLAEGRFMEWSPGAGFSSAASSPLYPFVVAAGWAAGLRDEAIILWALALGVAGLAASFFLLAAAARRLSPGGEGGWTGAWFAPLLFLLSGAQAWGYLSGMELPLFATALLLTLLAALRLFDEEEAGAPRRATRWALAASAALLGLLRPEGLFLGVMLAGLLAARAFLRGGAARGAASLAWLLVALPALAWGVVTLAGTGHAWPAAFYQKSYFHDPGLAPAGLLLLVLENVRHAARDVYAGGHSPPLLVLFFFAGVCGPAWRELAGRRPAGWTLLALWFFAGSLSTMMSIDSDEQQYRYQVPFFNLYLLGAGAGVARLVEAAGGRLRTAALGAALFFPFVQALELPVWAQRYGANCKNIFEQQAAMGRHIARALPADAVVGVNDAGAIPYYSGRRCYDVLGLGTEGQAAWRRAGPGSMYERFERLRAEALPTHFAIYPKWWFNADIMKEKLHEINLADNTICGDSYKVLVKADWRVLGSGHRLATGAAAGAAAADRVDVADLESEEAHGYRGPPYSVYAGMPAAGGDGSTVADGGRQVACGPAGGERMTLRGTGAALAGRFLGVSAPMTLAVRVNGKAAGAWALQPAAQFSEPSLPLPAGLLGPGDNTVEIACAAPGSYESYHYWLLR